MLRFGIVALGALTFLVSPSQTNAAAGVGPSDSQLELNPCITASVMAGTVACGIMATNIGRIVMKVAIGATLRGVDTELGDVDRLAREGAC